MSEKLSSLEITYTDGNTRLYEVSCRCKGSMGMIYYGMNGNNYIINQSKKTVISIEYENNKCIRTINSFKSFEFW